MDSGSPFFTLHNIDVANENTELSPLPGTTAAIEEWKTGLIKRIYDGEKRRFKFPSDTTEVVALIKKILSDDKKDACASRIAERLLEKEKASQDKVAHLVDIQKGALIQLLTTYEGKPAYLLAKIEHEWFLDEKDGEKHSGLPFERHIFKTCFITFDKDDEVLEVVVSDNKRKKISEYWSYDFLEVRELTTNEHNTRESFKVLEAIVQKKLKAKYPSDYTQIRNNLVGYFRTNATFSYKEMVNQVVGDYTPDNEGFKVETFKTELEALPAKFKEKGEEFFEETFDIIQSEIKAKYKKTIDLTDKITLKLKEDIDNIGSVITAVMHAGKKCIRIETEQGYSLFPKEKEAADVPA